MLYPFVPKRSGVHRIAAIALYRALLIKCRQTPLDYDTKTVIQNIVRRRFKLNRHVCSKPILSLAFRGGYDAIDLLDTAASGNSESIFKIHDFLKTVPDRAKQPTKPQPLPRKKSVRPGWLPPAHGPYTSILRRPYPKVSGIRRVPHLVVTNGIPFLRIRKPQPHHLTGLLARRKKRLQSRVDLLLALKVTALPVARWEDAWDRMICKDLGGPVPEEDGTTRGAAQHSWRHVVEQHGIAHLQTAMKLVSSRNTAVAERMLTIVKKEKALADAERIEREREAMQSKELALKALAENFKESFGTNELDSSKPSRSNSSPSFPA